MTALMVSGFGALELPSSAVSSLAALVMHSVGAPALPRPARSPPIIRCRTPSTADIAAAHRYAWPADWPSPFCLAGGGFALRAYWFGLHAPSSRRGKGCLRPPACIPSGPLPFVGLTRAGRHGISLVPREKHRRPRDAHSRLLSIPKNHCAAPTSD